MIRRNKKVIMILTTLLTIVLAISISYAFFYYGKENSEISLESGSISINFKEENNYLTLYNTYPISDSIGMINTNYYDFTVSGTKTKKNDILYEIQIEQMNNNTLQEEYIKLYLTNQNDIELAKINKLNELPVSKYNKNRIIYTNYIYNDNQVDDYRLRIWVDESYTKNIEEIFNFKLILYAINANKS